MSVESRVGKAFAEIKSLVPSLAKAQRDYAASKMMGESGSIWPALADMLVEPSWGGAYLRVARHENRASVDAILDRLEAEVTYAR